jgi:hypothetical protein
MNAVAVLTTARDMITQGWCQHTGTTMGPNGVRRCAGQALQDAWGQTYGYAHGSPWYLDSPPEEIEVYQIAHALLVAAIYDRVGPGRLAVNIAVWNDTHGRTQAEVIALFDDAIAAAEAGRAPTPMDVVEMSVVVPAVQVKVSKELVGV